MLKTPYAWTRWAALMALGAASAGARPDDSAPGPCEAWTESAVLAEVNATRAQGARCGERGGMAPAGALGWSPALYALALRQAAWMAEFGMLVHAGRDGETLSQRAFEAGYSFARIGENLARGQRTLAQVLDRWTASESHCVNLYDSGVTEMALACVPGRDGRPFWVLILGRPL